MENIRGTLACTTPKAGYRSQIIQTSHGPSFGQNVHLPARGNDLSAYPFSSPLSTEPWAGIQSQADLNDRETDLVSPTLDMSLDKLNQLILELDPTFQPLHDPLATSGSPQSSPNTDVSPEEDLPHSVLEKWSSPKTFHLPSASPHSSSIPIPVSSGTSCSPHGSLIFSSSPSRVSRNKAPVSASWDCQVSCSPGSLHLLNHRRGSGCSLLSCSSKSDTNYILGSCHSLLSDEAEGPDCFISDSSRSDNDIISSYPQSPSCTKPSLSEHKPDKSAQILHAPLHHSRRIIWPSTPNSLSSSPAGSVSSIPMVLINGAPEAKLEAVHPQTGPPILSSVQQQRNQPSMKFVMDTSQFWFRPHLTREEADILLQDQMAGSFVVRDSTSFRGSFGLALKVHEDILSFPSSDKPGGGTSTVRHYLIESSAKGLRLKGSPEEPYFGSLSALVYHHTNVAYALPCPLRVFSQDFRTTNSQSQETSGTRSTTKAAYNFLHLSTVATEMLTGACAIQKAVSLLFQQETKATPTIVNLMVSPRGITLTDIQRKVFFRQHYPGHLLSYCGEDPDNRSWPKDCKSATIFGFVTKGNGNAENTCHLLAPSDTQQPSSSAIQLIRGIITPNNTE